MARYYRKEVKKQEFTVEELNILSKIPTENIMKQYEGVQKSFSSKKNMEHYLIEESNKFLKKYFNTTLEIPLEISNRLTSSLGLFYSTHKKSPLRIAIKSDFFKYKQTDLSIVMSVVFHECVHYVLCKKGVSYHDDDLVFDTILNRLSIETNYQQNRKPVNSLYNLYKCDCGEELYVLKGTKNPRPSYPWVICDKCSNHIKYTRQEVGTFKGILTDFKEENNKFQTT